MLNTNYFNLNKLKEPFSAHIGHWIGFFLVIGKIKLGDRSLKRNVFQRNAALPDQVVAGGVEVALGVFKRDQIVVDRRMAGDEIRQRSAVRALSIASG